MNLFKPPAAARAAKVLDRSLFQSRLLVAAASIREPRLISKYRKELEKTKEVLQLQYVSPVQADPDLSKKGVKCLLLHPAARPNQPETWSSTLQEASKAGDIEVIPYDIDVSYDLWSYSDVLRSIIPHELQDEIPTSFNTAGHVAHLNLRDQYLPYKNIIAQVILDKNPHIRTVINKIDNVGTESEFRTFTYEVLAGPNDLNVEVSESGCVFNFDYSKVYWNTKLSYEHQRIADFFRPGEVVADVMAGIGPFAVPAGKNGVFVWANDKNPESFKCLTDIIQRNKVSEFVKPFCEDGHDFIKTSVASVLEASANGRFASVPVKFSRKDVGPRPKPIQVPIPPTISHFVMNLPASAIEFLHNYQGIYHSREELFSPNTLTELPIVHVHCFATKSADDVATNEIVNAIHRQIGLRLKPGRMDVEGELLIHHVRDVAPAKSMFCGSFRLPRSVAFGEPPPR